MVVAGADGCRAGWVICRRDDSGVLDIRVVKTLAEACEGLSVLAVDMPIGLSDEPIPGRACEAAARALMPGKASSVFPTPCRSALACLTHVDANAMSRKLGKALNQKTFHLFPKMREIDALMRGSAKMRRIVREAHPELAFARMNGGRPVLAKKRQPDGFAERLKLLAKHGLRWTPQPIAGAARDDVLDAMAVCRTAMLIADGTATRLGTDRERDRYGLPMNIWY